MSEWTRLKKIKDKNNKTRSLHEQENETTSKLHRRWMKNMNTEQKQN